MSTAKNAARKLAALSILCRTERSEMEPTPFRVRLTGATWCGIVARQNARLMEWPELAQRR